MEEMRLANFQENVHSVIGAVIHSRQPILISDEGQLLVKIVPFVRSKPESWLGCMRGTGKIIGDIVSPAGDPHAWEVLSL